MQKITNTRDVRLMVPSLHLETDPGDNERIPNDAAVPDGYELAQPPPASTKSDKSTSPKAAAADNQKEND